MFDYLAGEVAIVAGDAVVIDIGGIGFEVLADANTRGKIRVGEKTRLYSVVRIHDDRIDIYGFLEMRQRELFLKLTSVTGVGPKLALAILSGLKPDQLVMAVATEDVKALQTVPGVGKKTAQRVLLELREKVDFGEVSEAGSLLEALDGQSAGNAAAQAMEALEGLGYSHAEAMKAIAAVRSLGDTPEELVKFALKRFGPKA